MVDIRLIGFFGDFGSYKTALCTVFADVLSSGFGLPILADYKINLPQARYYEDSEIISLNPDDAIYCIDEIMMKADSRNSSSGANRWYGYFISQVRKSPKAHGVGNFVLYTSQLLSEADLRIFDLTNMKFLLKKTDNGDCEYTCVTGSDLDATVSEGVIPFSFFDEMCFKRDLYSTDEKVLPLAIESLRVQMEMFNSVKINARVDAACAAMLKKYRWESWKDVQRFTVEDYLDREGVPSVLSRRVFNRCRELVRVKG